MAFALEFEAGSKEAANSNDSTRVKSDHAEHAVLAIENMNCGGCLRKVEKVLEGAQGILTARGNLSAKRVQVTFDPLRTSTEAIVETLVNSGYRAADLSHIDKPGDDATDNALLRRVAVAGFAASNIMLLSVSVWAGLASDMDVEIQSLFHWLSALIALPTIAYAGQPFFSSALTALRAWRVNMDVPISLALLLATGMSIAQTVRGSEQVYFDASVTLVFFLLIGRYLDQSLRSRAKGAAQNLLGLRANSALVLEDDGTTTRLPARALQPGMRILVATGERIAVDGKVVSGTSDIEEQLITGETQPRTVAQGDLVYAGTVSLNGTLEVEATAADDKTLLAEIARLMQAAEQTKGRYVRLADKAAALYVPGVHSLGLATLVFWLAHGLGWEASLTTAISVLIITCPCALALAVPAVQVAATSRLFNRGIIMTKADGLERLAEVDTIVFDKTGTLTRGEPQLLNGDQIPDDVFLLAGSLASASRHPYARAVVREAETRGLKIHAVDNAVETPGSGISSTAQDNTELRLGSAEWCGAGQSGGTGDQKKASLYFLGGETSEPIAFQFTDLLREDARSIVEQCRMRGYDVHLLSGDQAGIVEKTAIDAGIDNWSGGQRPDEKIAYIEALKRKGRKVLMVGDGLNDAPALAAAHASISPASAVEVSQISSDGIIRGERLEPIGEVLSVAKRARRMSLENFGIAAIYNAICIPLAMAGAVTPLIAAIAMSASSIIVIANALRLTTAR